MSDKKAGLITFHYAHHYGAQLQAYALMKTIEILGTPCEVIHYVREDTIAATRLLKSGFSPYVLLSNLHTVLHLRAFKKRAERFQIFAHQKLKLGDRFYKTHQELFENPPQYSAYICGSDQIWNPLIFKEKTFDPAFFLGFSIKGKRIAYAPSFGISTIPDSEKESLKQYLKGMDYLSVRESQGEQIIRELTGCEALTVLDPTLLLSGDEWSKTAISPKKRRPYLLCYFISDASSFEPYIKALSDEMKLDVVYLAGSRKGIPAYAQTIYDAGPCEFIGYFKDAAFVCTNSFHGTVFSINFKKNFFSFTQGSDKKAVNSRLYSILDLLDIKDRMVCVNKENETMLFNVLKKQDVDYHKVFDLLELEKIKSLEYLKDALA